MAKKKRKAPTRACDKCGFGYHPRKAVCPKCGAKNPTVGPRKKKVVKKSTAAPKTKRKTAPAHPSMDHGLNLAVSFVRDCGSLAVAKEALARIEEIQAL